MKKIKKLLLLIVVVIAIYSGYHLYKTPQPISSNETNVNAKAKNKQIQLKEIPAFSNKPYITVNENIPNFSKGELTTKSFERYSQKDWLGRCGVAVANLSLSTMPKEKRESISHVKPSGWQSTKYPNVEGGYLYNRCHLIGFQLGAENDNDKNLITGTRYLNVNGMLPFENAVADYIKKTKNHVLYRVTPLYKGVDLVAHGVLMEAISCEDQGKGIRFSVYVYNNQPGINIDYLTGKSRLVNRNATAPKISLDTTYREAS